MKFRYWDLRVKEMREEALQLVNNDICTYNTSYYLRRTGRYGVIWMAEIGIVDSKGKKIHDRDILLIRKGEQVIKGQVSYDPNRAQYMVGSKGLCEFLEWDILVIGNEFQPPRKKKSSRKAAPEQ